MRKPIVVVLLVTTFLSVSSTEANEGESFVEGTIPITLISDVNRQAEAWAICFGAYEIKMMSKSPNEALHSDRMDARRPFCRGARCNV